MNKKSTAKVQTQINSIKDIDADTYDKKAFVDAIFTIRSFFLEEAMGRHAVAELAHLLGVKVVQVYQWCDGACYPSFRTASKVSKKLNDKGRKANSSWMNV